MTVLKRRDRIVVFRLTRDEYHRLQKACSTTGARSLSDYTRRELLNRAAEPTADGGLEVTLSQVDRKLEDLQEVLRQIEQTLKQRAPSSE